MCGFSPEMFYNITARRERTMQSERKLHLGNAVLRMILVGISIVLQIGWILVTVLLLNEQMPWLEMVTRLLSVAVVLQLNSKHTGSAYKMPWIMLIMAVPVMGLSLYLMIEIFGDIGKMGKRLRDMRALTGKHLQGTPGCLEKLRKQNLPGAGLSSYLQSHAQRPLYENTAADYYSDPADAFEAMKEDLKKADSFIFMEYFIVSGDSAFREIADILIQKANQGVDVRFMYDDVGSVGYVNMFFAKQLSDAGIRCMIFNPALPLLNLFINHRDHRKITVIDGKIGYTGGYNLSDEYFGRKITHGRWKDTGIRLEGEAVQSFTAAFLEMWNACTKDQEPVDRYLSVRHRVASTGYVQPYEDNPLGKERTAENVYLNLIYSATKSLYITTPYLIITDEMVNALGMAAKRGVDIRIITPGIPDKKIVYALTRSYYAGLAAQGVRIFEFTPGFCHAKQMLCDGQTASIGTSNLDYRSLYLNFENNVLLYGGDSVQQIAQDFEDLFPQCEEVTEQYCTDRSKALRIGQYILRLFAPMM